MRQSYSESTFCHEVANKLDCGCGLLLDELLSLRHLSICSHCLCVHSNFARHDEGRNGMADHADDGSLLCSRYEIFSRVIRYS
ncbi:unnamed protein product [Ixodes pacificus]